MRKAMRKFIDIILGSSWLCIAVAVLFYHFKLSDSTVALACLITGLYNIRDLFDCFNEEDSILMDDIKAIYIISVFERCRPGQTLDGNPDLGVCEAVGYRFDYESAYQTVKNNCCDIWESCFDYAVIAEVLPTVYPEAKIMQVFMYNRDTNKYEPIDTPDILKRPGIGLGGIGWTSVYAE